jgi:hypothetical protein
MGRRAALVIVSGLLLAALLPAPARAGVFLGQYSSAEETYCGENRAHAQEAISGGVPYTYTASVHGVITWWITGPTPEPGHTVQLIVLRRYYSGVDHYFTVTAKDAVRSQSTSLNEFDDVRVPIEAGEELGLYVPPGQPVVTFMGITAPAGVCLNTPNYGMGNRYRTYDGNPPFGASLDYDNAGSGYRLAVQVYVEPDADGDGFGDESQDRCRIDPSTQGFCPSATVPPPRVAPRTVIRRKCKRKKKAAKRSATAAKRKRCRRKKKR